MARVTKTRKQPAAPRTPMELLMHEHLAALSVRGYSENTVHSRRVYLGFFIEWAYQHGLQEPIEVTRPGTRTLSAVSLLLPQEERRTADLPQPAHAACTVARVVSMDDAGRTTSCIIRRLRSSCPGWAIACPKTSSPPPRLSRSWRCARSRNPSACATGRCWKSCTAPECAALKSSI